MRLSSGVALPSTSPRSIASAISVVPLKPVMTLNFMPARLLSRYGIITVDEAGPVPPMMVSRVRTSSIRLTGTVCQTIAISTAEETRPIQLNACASNFMLVSSRNCSVGIAWLRIAIAVPSRGAVLAR